MEADLEADFGDGVVGRAQQRRRPLQPSRQQVDVRGLAEGAPELAMGAKASVAVPRTNATAMAVSSFVLILIFFPSLLFD